MARERQDLNLFYGNCDLDLENIQAWGKNSDRFRGNSNTKEETRCVRVCRERREKSRSETTTDGNGEVNRPRCYASVNEYIRKRFLSRSA